MFVRIKKVVLTCVGIQKFITFLFFFLVLSETSFGKNTQNICLGVSLFFRLKEMCFQIELIIIRWFNNIFVPFVNLLLFLVLLQELWLGK